MHYSSHILLLLSPRTKSLKQIPKIVLKPKIPEHRKTPKTVSKSMYFFLTLLHTYLNEMTKIALNPK